VALVRIKDAGLKPAARGLLEMQYAQKSPKIACGHHRTTLFGYIFEIRRKKLDENIMVCPIL